MTPAEHNYCYSWSSHLMAAAGCIGHLRGDMGREGNSFYTTWFDHQEDLKTQAFKDELDIVVTALRFDAAYGGALADRSKLAAYCRAHPESGMGTISLPSVPVRHEGKFRMDGNVRLAVESVAVLGADARLTVGAGVGINIQIAVAALVHGAGPAVGGPGAGPAEHPNRRGVPGSSPSL